MLICTAMYRVASVTSRTTRPSLRETKYEKLQRNPTQNPDPGSGIVGPPQDGVGAAAPRPRMYGLSLISGALARTWKSSGQASNASWTEHDQFDKLSLLNPSKTGLVGSTISTVLGQFPWPSTAKLPNPSSTGTGVSGGAFA